MGQVQGIGAKLGLGGVDLGTKSMTNVMQSNEGWAKGILEADRASIKNATVLNQYNSPNAYRSRGNANLYGALSNGLALQQPGWQSRDATVQKKLDEWTTNLNQHETFRGRGSYTPKMLLQIAADAKAAACQLRENIAELREEAEVGPNDMKHWGQVADGLSDYAAKLEKLHAAVCVKQDPPITEVTLDIAASQH